MNTKIENLVDEALIYAANERNQVFINKAIQVYHAPFGDQKTDLDMDQGFNNWLIHDYVYQGKSLIDDIEGDLIVKNSIKNSRYSVYKIRIEHEKIVLKDVVTGEDYVLQTEQYFEENDLMKIRIYPVENYWIMNDVPEFYDSSLEDVIRKSVMTQYNNYCAAFQPVHIREFVKSQSQLILHLTNIIDFYEAELNEDEGFEVYVSTFALKNRDEVLDLLLNTDDFLLIENDGDETIIHMVSDHVQLAEIVVTSFKMEIEAVSKVQLEMVKSTVSQILEDRVVFIKDEMLSLDDLL
ncbi:MAG: hypothetical protein JXR88_11380 [Clostridia bacterium]|nr:hypothetical protein [Clostridia bacterium]